MAGGNKRKTPQFSASSMADIAFLLLIFFLMVTTMNVDSGIQRMLPPMPDDEAKDAIDIKRRNILQVNINRFDQIQVDGEVMEIQAIKDKVKEFMTNPTNDDNLPEKKVVEIDLIGKYPVGQGVVSLQNDRGTSYNIYIMVQNELTRALNEIRDDVAKEYFGKTFIDLSEEQRESVIKAVPTKISEAEPRNIEGGR